MILSPLFTILSYEFLDAILRVSDAIYVHTIPFYVFSMPNSLVFDLTLWLLSLPVRPLTDAPYTIYHAEHLTVMKI